VTSFFEVVLFGGKNLARRVLYWREKLRASRAEQASGKFKK
jgi:hypothetical protein